MTNRIGPLGAVGTFFLNIFSLVVAEEHLKIISLVMAIIVSFLTIIWYISNLIMKRKEIMKGIKEMFPSLFRKHK